MLITNGILVTWDDEYRIIEGNALRVDGGKITHIGDQQDLLKNFPTEEILDAHGQLVMPGNICAHTHFYGAYSRGMGIPGDAPNGFVQILEKLWWPLDKALDKKSVRASAQVCILDAIRHGTTTLFDHHASPAYIEGSLDEIYHVVKESGIRASLCYEVTDRNGLDQADAGIRENSRFANWVLKNHPLDGRISATFGLHASLTVSDDTLEKSRQAKPEGVGFHIHVAESEADEYDSLNKYGLRTIDRLEKFGILGPKTIVAHAVHIDSRETELLVKNDVWVTHQPRSNMNNAVGMAAVESMDRAGVKMCLGNDGFSNTMWDEWKAAYLAHKLWHHDPRRMNGSLVAKMAINQNRNLVANQFFGKKVGILEPDAQADIILVDYHPYTPLTSGNIPWHIIFGFNESLITTCMVNGVILMKNREIVCMDEEKVFAEAKELAPGVWQRYAAQF
jgi:putative selenium metabolism protein SsnA